MSYIIDPDTLAPAVRVVPDGDYTLRVEEAQLVTAKTGRPQLAVTLRIVGGEYDGASFQDFIVAPLPSEGPEEQKRVAWRLGNFMRALRLPAMAIDLVPQESRGKVFQASVTRRKGDRGGEFNTVQSFFRAAADAPSAEVVKHAEQAASAAGSTEF